MAKLGYLYLKKGKWCGEQIVSEKWIEEATSEHIKLNSQIKSYGYQWWLYRYDINNKIIEGYSANGHGGQHIFVFPSLDAVIVLTAGNYNSTYDLITNRVMKSYILPALITPK